MSWGLMIDIVKLNHALWLAHVLEKITIFLKVNPDFDHRNG